MIFFSDCRFLGGLVTLSPPTRLCASAGQTVTTCDGCSVYSPISSPCHECGVFAACKAKGRSRTRLATLGDVTPVGAPVISSDVTSTQHDKEN